MRVFVSGIAGFLGSHLAERYLQAEWSVAGVDNMLGGLPDNIPEGAEVVIADCNDPEAYRHLLRECDVVYHCAAAPYEGLSPFSPALVYRHTLQSTVSLLSASLSAGAGRFVLCSSMARYGAQSCPFVETAEPAPVDPYGLAKVGAEQAVRALCEFHGVQWAIAVPHNIYGPRQRYIDPFRNVVGIVINRMLSGRQPIIYGDGSQRRCFSYIEDVVEPLVRMGTSEKAAGEVVNLGPEDADVSILDLVKTIGCLLAVDVEPTFVDPRPLEVHTATCSARKASELLGYRSTWSLQDGLARTIDWIRRRGARPFEYHLPLEILTPRTPRTWAEQLL